MLRGLATNLAFMATATALLASNASSAQSGAYLSEDDYLAEVPVVLTLGRLEQAITEAPIASTVITREMIDASGARDITDVLRLVPGMVATPQRGLYWQVVAYHGLSDEYSRRMQILIDGRSVYVPNFGGTAWMEFPLIIDDIEKIEVIRGPSAATHGANAFLGVISITTRNASESEGVSFKAVKGNKGTGDGLIRYGFSHDAYSHRLTFQYKEDDGFENAADSREVTQATWRSDLRLSTVDTLSLRTGYLNGNLDNQESVGPVNDINQSRTYGHFQDLEWRRSISSDQEVKIQLYHNYYRIHDVFDAEGVFANRSFEEERYDLELQHIFEILGTSRIVWGGGARYELMEAEQPLFQNNTEDYAELYRAFINAETHLSQQWLLHSGLMLEKHSIAGSDLSTRMGLTYLFSRDSSVRLVYSRAYRNPTPFEEGGTVTFDFMGTDLKSFDTDPGLKTERIDAYELGYVLNIPRYRLLFDMKIFYDELRNLIGLTCKTDPGCSRKRIPFDFRNSDDVTLSGVEAQMTYHATRNSWFRFSYGYTDVDSDDIDGKYSLSVPQHTASLMFSHRIRDFTMSVSHNYIDEMRFIDSERFFVPDTSRNLDAHHRVDLKLAKDLTFAQFDGEVYIVVQNLLDDEFFAYRPQNIYDQRAQLGLRVGF